MAVASNNGNSAVFRWIAVALLMVVMAAGGLVVDSVNNKVDTLKADSTAAITHAEARIDANQAEIIELKGDVKLIKYQTQQILDLVKEMKEDSG